MLNGHEYVACQDRKPGNQFEETAWQTDRPTDGSFTEIRDGTGGIKGSHRPGRSAKQSHPPSVGRRSGAQTRAQRTEPKALDTHYEAIRVAMQGSLSRTGTGSVNIDNYVFGLRP